MRIASEVEVVVGLVSAEEVSVVIHVTSVVYDAVPHHTFQKPIDGSACSVSVTLEIVVEIDGNIERNTL